MDSFFIEQNNNFIKDNKIVVFGDKKGKHYNTYIVGWDLPDKEIKETMEKLKKRFGCGGAIKNITYNGSETQSINLQGNFVIKVGEYMKSLKLENLIIKEFIN